MKISTLQKVQETVIFCKITPDTKLQECNPPIRGYTLRIAGLCRLQNKELGKNKSAVLGRRAAIPLGRVSSMVLR